MNNAHEQVERMKRELWSDLMLMVESGEMSDQQAMEWFNDKCEQWKEGAA